MELCHPMDLRCSCHTILETVHRLQRDKLQLSSTGLSMRGLPLKRNSNLLYLWLILSDCCSQFPNIRQLKFSMTSRQNGTKLSATKPKRKIKLNANRRNCSFSGIIAGLIQSLREPYVARGPRVRQHWVILPVSSTLERACYSR